MDLILNRSTNSIEMVELEYRLDSSFSDAINSFLKKFHNNLVEGIQLRSCLFSLSFTPSQLNLAFEAFRKAFGAETPTESIGRSISQPSENIFSFGEDFQRSADLINTYGLFDALANNDNDFFLKKLSKAITIVMGEGKFEQFSESLCHLKRLKNLNDLAKVLYRYFKQESNIELHSDVKVILDLDEKEKSILKNWQNAACGFSNNLTKAESLGEIHEALLDLRLDVQKKLPSILFILIGLFYKAMFLDNADIAGLLEEYIEKEGNYLVKILTEKTTSQGIPLYSLLVQNDKIFESFHEISKLYPALCEQTLQISSPLHQEEIDRLFYFASNCQGSYPYRVTKLVFDTFLRRNGHSALLEGFHHLPKNEQSSLIELSRILTNGTSSTANIETISQELRYDRKTLLFKRLAEVIVERIKAKSLYLYKSPAYSKLHKVFAKEGLNLMVNSINKPIMLSANKVFREYDDS